MLESESTGLVGKCLHQPRPKTLATEPLLYGDDHLGGLLVDETFAMVVICERSSERSSCELTVGLRPDPEVAGPAPSSVEAGELWMCQRLIQGT